MNKDALGKKLREELGNGIYFTIKYRASVIYFVLTDHCNIDQELTLTKLMYWLNEMVLTKQDDSDRVFE